MEEDAAAYAIVMSVKMQWDEMNESKRGGSVVGRSYIERDTHEGHQNLMRTILTRLLDTPS
jgi:hypothetical protein